MGSQRVGHDLGTKQQQHEANCKVGGEEGQGLFFFSFFLDVLTLKKYPFGFVGGSFYYTEEAMAPHSSTLAWKIPWTEEPGRLQSMSC